MGKKKQVILFELVLEQELLRLEKELKKCSYKHGGYTKFKIYQPKERIARLYVLWNIYNAIIRY